MFVDVPKVSVEGPIVVVDDDETEIILIRSYLEFTPIDRPVLAFNAGRSFLAYLDQVESGEETMPALVLLDIRMPHMDGYQVLKEVKSRESFRNIPVMLMFSNSKDETDIEHSQALGADGYQVKPATKEEYLEFFDNLFAA